MLVIFSRREILTLRDGGEVALDWVKADMCNNPTILLILPGLTGSSTHNYIGYMVMDGVEQNFLPVVFNQRGNGGIAMKVGCVVSYSLITGTNICDLVLV